MSLRGGLIILVNVVSLCRECGCMTKDVPFFSFVKCGKCGFYKAVRGWKG